LDTGNTILNRGSGIEFREVEEQTWVANTIAVELTFKLSGKLLEAVSDLSHLSNVVRVLRELGKLEFVQVLVAVPEVVEGNRASSCIHVDRQVPTAT
jgi:hypothetical protein